MERTLKFTPEHEMFRSTFRKFVENEIVPNYAQWEKDKIVPREVFKKMGDLGFLCPWAEEKYGGVSTGWAKGNPVPDILPDMIMMEELGWRSVIGVFSHLHNFMTSPYIDTYGDDEQRERWLPGLVSGEKICAIAMTEPGTGSDLGAVRTKAVRDGDDYIINGSKTFISNGVLADVVIVVCRTGEGYKGLSLIVVERGAPGFERSKPIPKIGLHPQDTATLYFEDCRVPAANLLGEEGDGWGQLMSKLQPERLCGCQLSTAMAERAVQLAVQYTQERTIFGKSLGSFQNTQFVLAECATKAQICRTFTDTLVVNYINGQDITQEVSMGKYWVCETAIEVASKCLQIFGGYGYCEEYEISRIYNDSRVFTILAGSTEVMKLIISRGIGVK